MSNSLGVLIFLFLCIAVILVSGVLLPKYLSSEILELRKELNSQSSNSKYSLQANLDPVAEKLTQNKGYISSRNAKELNESILSPEKVKKRNKRQADSDDEYFHWNFSFNLTGQRNHDSQESTEIASNTSNKDKSLGIALITEGEAKKKSAFAEIQHSLQAVEYFFKYLFAAKNLAEEGKSIKELERSDVAELEDGSDDGSLERGREGKFIDILKLLGIGVTSEKSVSSSTSVVPITESVTKSDNLLISQSPAIDSVTETSQEMPNLSTFQAQSLILEELPVESKTLTSESSLPGKSEDGECIDCGSAGLETPVTSKFVEQTKNDQSDIVAGSTEFTDEFLEMFCMSLVNKVGVSQHLSDSDEGNLEPKENIIDENDIRSPENPVTDLIPTSIPEGELNQEFDTEMFIMTNDTPISENKLRQKKFLILSSFLGFGSGRTAEDQNESNELSEKFSDVDLNNLPTLLDCENHFRKNVKMFPKPNLMDIMSDPKIQFADFANATISPNLIEQQLQFLTSLLKTNLDNKQRSFSENYDMATKSVPNEIILENDVSTMNEVPKEVLTLTEPNDLRENTKILITSTDVDEDQQATDVEKDGRFFSIFGFTSGNGESRSLGNDFDNDTNEILGGRDDETNIDADKNELGSGDFRSLWAAPLGTNKNEFGSGDLRSLGAAFGIQEKEFGSGDLRSLGAAFGIQENEFGSGDLRSLKGVSFSLDKSELGSGDSRSLWAAPFGTDRNESGSGDSRLLVSEIDELSSGSRSLEGFPFRTETDEFGSGNMRTLEEVTFGTETDEFGSGNMRTLEEVTFGTETDEFGSGNMRTLEEVTFGTETDEFGSGNMRTLEEVTFGTETDEFGSGNMRTLEEVTFGTETDEFGSGNMRSVEGVIFETEKHEFGSGSMRSFEQVTFGNEKDELGSGSLRSLELGSGGSRSFTRTTSEIEINEFGSGDSFKQISDFTTETYEDLRSMTPNNPRFWNILGLAGSGDGRDLPVNVIEDTQEKSTETNDQRFLMPVFLTGSGDGGLFGDSGGPINLLEEDESTSVDTSRHTSIKDQIVSEDPLDELTTKINSQRFLRPIFLTGSGDGGLFEDDGGPINLVEESTRDSQIPSSRRSRLDDIPQNFSEALHESFFKQSEEKNAVDSNVVNGKFTSPAIPFRRGRLEDSIDELDYGDFTESYQKKANLNDSSKFGKRTNGNSDGTLKNVNFITTTSTDATRSTISNFPNLTKVTKFETRSCTAARECNVTLNERCVTISSSRICGCSKGYARNKETGKCIVKKIVETSLKFPAEHFEEDLKNPLSPGFQQKRKSTIDLIMLLLQNDPEILRILSEIDVEFSSGSLVAKINLVFATENKTREQLIKHVEDDIQIALNNETLLMNVSFNASDASLVSVNGEIDYCKSSDLNYCSENAYCLPNRAHPSGYECHCKEHYRDASYDPSRFGETCMEKCPKEYCGAYGHCELLANDERMCLCMGLYFGRRCEVPGLYVLIALGFGVFVSITVLLWVIFKRKCSRFSYRESQAHGTEETRRHSHMNGKVSDAIALEENVGNMKFVSISTPIPHPVIRITRPTVNESAGSSCEFGSTFDSTPSTHVVVEDDAQSSHKVIEDSNV